MKNVQTFKKRRLLETSQRATPPSTLWLLQTQLKRPLDSLPARVRARHWDGRLVQICSLSSGSMHRRRNRGSDPALHALLTVWTTPSSKTRNYELLWEEGGGALIVAGSHSGQVLRSGRPLLAEQLFSTCAEKKETSRQTNR